MRKTEPALTTRLAAALSFGSKIGKASAAIVNGPSERPGSVA